MATVAWRYMQGECWRKLRARLLKEMKQQGENAEIPLRVFDLWMAEIQLREVHRYRTHKRVPK